MTSTHRDLPGGAASRSAQAASARAAREAARWRNALQDKRISRLGRDRRLYLGWCRSILAGEEFPSTLHARALVGIGAVVIETPGIANPESAVTVVVHGRDGCRPHLYVPAHLAREASLRQESWVVVTFDPTRIALRVLGGARAR